MNTTIWNDGAHHQSNQAIAEMEKTFSATVWNDGSHHQSGAGYGIKINEEDRDTFFKKEWKSVFLKLAEQDDGEIEINIDKPSFWNKTCRELISKEIGLWLMRNNRNCWKKGNPPRVKLEPTGTQRFNVHLA